MVLFKLRAPVREEAATQVRTPAPPLLLSPRAGVLRSRRAGLGQSVMAQPAAYLAMEGSEGGVANDKPPALLRAANILALLGIFAANGTAGKSIGAVARRWSNHIKPDGWALSIWLVIYALLVAFAVWQGRSATPRCSEIVKRIGWLF